jgi:secreted effector protein SseF
MSALSINNKTDDDFEWIPPGNGSNYDFPVIEKPLINPPDTLNKSSIKITTPDKNHDEDKFTLKETEINLCKKQFFLNVIELLISSVSFGVSVLMAVGSGGVATPLVALTGLNLMLSVANLACSWHNWNCACKGEGGLTMGNDALQQVVFTLAKYCQASEEKAKKIAGYTAWLMRAGIFISISAMGFVIHPVVNSALCQNINSYIPLCISTLNAIPANLLKTWMCQDNDARERIINNLINNHV